jgi:hypothetical protein
MTVASLPVGPYGTVDYSLAAAMNELPLPLPFCSIRIQYRGAPGSMEAEVSSVEARSDLVVDARVENEGNGWAGSGANPWHLDQNTESILFLTNESNQPVRIGFQVTANGIHYYLTQLKLQPHETRAINIRSLRDAQLADFKKNKIPAAATDGSVTWIRLDNVPVMGRLMVITRHQAMASSYDCYTCNCPASLNGVAIDPSSFGLIPNLTMACTCQAQFIGCNEMYTYYTETDEATWSSSDVSVATVDNANAKGTVEGIAAGSATIAASYAGFIYYWNGYSCATYSVTMTGSSSVTVQSPYAAVVVGTNIQGAAACPSGEAGWSRTVKLQLQDQDGYAINVAGINMADNIQVGSRNDLGVRSTRTANTNTDSLGTWTDTYFVCSTACPTSGESDALQYWTWSGRPLPHVNAIVYKCTSITNDGK